MRDGDAVAGPLGHVDGLQGLRHRADLVELDQNGVGHALLDAALEDLRVGDEQVVAGKLHPRPETLREARPALPVVLGHAVLDRGDRVAVRPRFEKIDEAG